jgi:ribosomal-protein-alanine N-acetyltransferase
LKTPTLETDRLTLRPLTEDDAPRIQELFPKPEILQYMAAAIPWPYPDDGAISFVRYSLAAMDRGERYAWAITEKAGDDQPIGCIDLFPTNPDDNRGFWLGLPYQGKGYMIEAVAAVNDFAFDVLGLDRLILNNAESNIGSHRLKEKAGAAILEITDDVPYVGGVDRQIRWTLTRERWHANRDRFLRRSTE